MLLYYANLCGTNKGILLLFFWKKKRRKKSIVTCFHLPLCLAFFTGFSSMQSKDLFLLGTLLKKLRPCMLGWAWPPFWLTPFRKAPLRDWDMFCWKFCVLERISAHSRNPWAWARSAAVSPLAFLTLHNTRTSVRQARCTLPSHIHARTHTHRQTYDK